MVGLYTIQVSLSEFMTVAATGIAGIYAIDKISNIDETSHTCVASEQHVRITTHISDTFVADSVRPYLEEGVVSREDVSKIATLILEGDVTGADQVREYLLSLRKNAPLTIEKKTHFYWIDNTVGLAVRNGTVTLAIEIRS